jgi:hypothetical protein
MRSPDLDTATTTTPRGFTVHDLAVRYRVSPDKIRVWIRKNLLKAINTADVTCARPRYVITPEALRTFEEGRAANEPPKPVRKRRNAGEIDFYPDND